MNKKRLVVWSGGIDSTAIVLNLYRQKLPFHTIYFKFENNERKSKCEENARNIIKNILKLEQFEGDYKDFSTEINLKGEIGTYGIQPLTWQYLLLLFLGDIHIYDEIYLGYHREDDFWHLRTNIEWGFHYFACTKGIKTPSFIYPLEWHFKQQIIDYFYKIDEIGQKCFHKVWTCENPLEDVGGRILRCKECNPCLVYNKLNISDIKTEIDILNESLIKSLNKDNIHDKLIDYNNF